MTSMQEESLRRILTRMVENRFTRQEVLEIVSETGTPHHDAIQAIIDEYFPLKSE